MNNILKKQFYLIAALIFVFSLSTQVAYAVGLVISGNSTLEIDDETLEVTSDVDLSGGLTLSTGNINVGGNWTDDSKFTAGNGSVKLNGSGTTQTLNGTSTFYNLTKTVETGESAGTLTVNINGQHTITNSLTLKGRSGAPLSLRSSGSGTQFLLVLQSGKTQSLDFLDVKDANATGGENYFLLIQPIQPTTLIGLPHLAEVVAAVGLLTMIQRVEAAVVVVLLLRHLHLLQTLRLRQLVVLCL